MDTIEIVKQSKFYTELNSLLREQFDTIKRDIDPVYEQLLEERKFPYPLPIICQFEYKGWERNVQWRLELDFDEYQWSSKTIKPHFLNALVFLEIGTELLHFKYQLCSSFNDFLEPKETEKIELEKLNDTKYVSEKINEVQQFLDGLSRLFIQELEQINFYELEYMEDDVRMNKKIQDKWKEGAVVGYDCITYGDGYMVMANTYCVEDSETNEVKRHWFPLCDTTLTGIERYDEDIWSEIDIFHGSFTHKDKTIVFGDGAMGNEGYVASLNEDKTLDWSIFFTFSNPIIKAKVAVNYLICYGDTGCVIKINLDNLTEINVSYEDPDDLLDAINREFQNRNI
ncbi:hypothetical protein [uncultured Aquimarina sp.]|uniref:hypothetical protein n=1 Tax=uncultured Aquimarina sp. TaxID=575652 RepID=UPI00261E0E70|nr:hypothetical protein [uncultured Aquimarina sp.]